MNRLNPEPLIVRVQEFRVNMNVIDFFFLQSLAIRDAVRDCLEKDPGDRGPEDIDTLLEFAQQLPAFCNLTPATKRALCAGEA